jgi:hypothetical protein
MHRCPTLATFLVVQDESDCVPPPKGLQGGQVGRMLPALKIWTSLRWNWTVHVFVFVVGMVYSPGHKRKRKKKAMVVSRSAMARASSVVLFL